MEHTFYFPNYITGSDGARRMVSETEMEATIEADGDDWYVVAIYAVELVPDGERFELRPHSAEYREARNYLYSNPQERERIDAAWSDQIAEEFPRRRSAVNENSTHWGRL